MVIWWTTTGELATGSPKIYKHNIKKEGMFISCPGTLIFRTKAEALQGVEEARAWLAKTQTAAEYGKTVREEK